MNLAYLLIGIMQVHNICNVNAHPVVKNEYEHQNKLKPTKVFVIGFHETSNPSLSVMLTTLGYHISELSNLTGLDTKKNLYSIVDNLLGKFDAFQDYPWPLVYKYVDKKVPGSKFILTVRDDDSWIHSVINHFQKANDSLNQWIYGPDADSPLKNETIYLDRYNKHNNDVINYFADRANDLLVINFTRGDVWEDLCKFLDTETTQDMQSSGKFHHKNDKNSNSRLVHILHPVKVFEIGFHKTGTTSIQVALQTLGYKVISCCIGLTDPNISKNVYSLVDDAIDQYDAFQDNPWPIVYEYVDKKKPGSKFILTIRDPNSWIESAEAFFGDNESHMRRWIYGPDAGSQQKNRETYLERYNRHNRDVMNYFANRTDDLLVMDLAKGDGWEKLCPFLGIQTIPTVKFPHKNQHGNHRLS